MLVVLYLAALTAVLVGVASTWWVAAIFSVGFSALVLFAWVTK